MPPPAVFGAVAVREAVLPGWPGCVMLRSIGRVALGDVAVDGGAEKVCEPRLPKLERGRASAIDATNATPATRARAASSGRNFKRRMCRSLEAG
jgi:hypothetical protein